MSTKTIKNGVKWTVREGYERIPDRFDSDDFLSGLNDKCYTLVKENRVRSVISMPGSDINENGIYIKYFKKGDYRDYIKHLFVPTKARTEWEVGNALLRKEINTALPLAISEGKSQLLLITETVTDCEDLLEFCQANFEGTVPVEKESEKKKLLKKLALFIRDIHEKGFCHYDLHAGNILIRFNKEQNVSDYDLYLMDLHRVKIFKCVSTGKRIFNLAQIFNSLYLIMTSVDKLNFIRSYGTDVLISSKNDHVQFQKDNHSISPPCEGGEKGEIAESNKYILDTEQLLIRQIDEQSSRIRNVHYRSRMKRCMKESSVFSKKKFPGKKIFYRKGHDIESFQELIGKHNTALVNNNDRAVIIKRDSKTALTRHAIKDKIVGSVVVKQYRAGSPGCLLKNIFRGSAGRKAWVAGNGLRVYGFSTPLPLALIEKMKCGVTADSYVIMEEVRDSLEMDRYILKNFINRLETNQHEGKDHFSAPPSKRGDKITTHAGDLLYKSSLNGLRKKREFINSLAETLGRMHNHNIFHHDLKTCNIMVKEKDKSFDFTFLDFDRVSFNEEITVRKRVKNLTQINLSTPRLITQADRFRFMKKYLEQCNIMGEKKDLLRNIISFSKTEKILYVSFNGDVTEDW